jgi:uncharacterized membrane protein
VLILCLFVGIDFSTVISIPAAIGFMFLLSFLFTAFGIIIASLLPDFQGFQLVMNFCVIIRSYAVVLSSYSSFYMLEIQTPGLEQQ